MGRKVEEMSRIPATIEEAISELGGIAELLQAKRWQRAAIVYAFTREGENGRPTAEKPRNIPRFSPVEFARLRIAGLTDDNTVRLYRKVWQAAIDLGAAGPVAPGDEFEPPALDWKAVYAEFAPKESVYERRSDLAANITQAPPERKAEVLRELVADADASTASVVLQDLAEKATPETQRAVFTSLAQQPEVVDDHDTRGRVTVELDRAQERYVDKAEARRKADPVVQAHERGIGSMDVERALSRFIKDGRDALSRAGRVWDPLALSIFIREAKELIADIEYFAEHGETAVDSFTKEVLRGSNG